MRNAIPVVMDKSEFQSRAVEAFHSMNYIFDEDFLGGQTVQRPSTAKSIMVKGTALAVGGIITAFGTGFSKFSDSEVTASLGKLKTMCDFSALQLKPNVALLALFIFADDLPDETLVGRSLLIRKEIKDFKKFTMKMGFATGIALADVFFVFFNPDKAFHFRQAVQASCKHTSFFEKTYVLPWSVNLTGKNIGQYSGRPILAFKLLNPTDIEGKLFS